MVALDRGQNYWVRTETKTWQLTLSLLQDVYTAGAASSFEGFVLKRELTNEPEMFILEEICFAPHEKSDFKLEAI